jgi:hypothetical protein
VRFHHAQDTAASGIGMKIFVEIAFYQNYFESDIAQNEILNA